MKIKSLSILKKRSNMQKTKNKVQELYERRGKFYHSLFVDFFGLGKRFEKLFLQSNYIKSDMKVLDAGCGSGALLWACYKTAHERGFRNITYHGFDLTQAMLDHFNALNKEQGVNNIELRQADLLQLDQLPKEWRNYDLIISNGMLEYIPKLELTGAMNNLKLLLKDGGILIIFIVRSNMLTKFLIEWWWKARTFKASEINIALHKAGFTQIKINNFGLMNNMLFIESKK